jgi:hypothetical protein
MEANNILFRCSSLGYLMAEPKKKTEVLSEGAKTHLVDVYVSNKYNRFTEINSKYLDKGNDSEEDSITIVSLKTKQFFIKNQEHLSNEFIKGTPDLFTGKSIYEAETIRDTKSSWDVYTFNRSIHAELKDLYYWQGMGYMWLTGARKCYVDYCLNNTPWNLIEQELRKESYNHPENDTPQWIELQIIARHVYDLKTFNEYREFRNLTGSDDYSKIVIAGFVEIPLNERHFAFEFDRDENEIERLKAKIMHARIYLNQHLFKVKDESISIV